MIIQCLYLGGKVAVQTFYTVSSLQPRERYTALQSQTTVTLAAYVK